MPGEVRAVNLMPLRSPRASQGKSSCLLAQHQIDHPEEPYLPPIIRQPDRFTTVVGYEFFGRFVEFARVSNREVEGFVGTLLSAPHMRISDVAAMVLEQAFGAASKAGDAFAVEWEMPGAEVLGGVFWHRERDHITAFAGDKLVLTVKGRNVVNAAIVLPRLLEVYREEVPRIPEGVQSIGIEVGGAPQAWSMAASPLQVEFSLPPLWGSDYALLDGIVRDAFLAAVANRVS